MNATTDASIMKLAEAIAGLLQDQLKTVPVDLALWDARQVADCIGVDKRQVLERYALLPAFPRAVRLPTPAGTKGHPRWKAKEIIAWVNKHQERRAAA